MDLYDKALSYFQDHPDTIQDIWDDPKSHYAGVLFQAVTPTGYSQENDEGLSAVIFVKFVASSLTLGPNRSKMLSIAILVSQNSTQIIIICPK